MSIPSLETVYATVSRDYRLQVLTPLLMHGWQEQKLNHKGKLPVRAETRVPSLKGMLRYWWRALQADTTYEPLLKAEQQLFGGVGEKEGRRSPVVLQIQQPLRSEKTALALPHRNGVQVKGIEENQSFILTMRLYQKDAHLLETYHNWLGLMFMLSGFGQRARRGAGALQYEDFKWSSTQEFQAQLRSILEQCQKANQFTFADQDAVLRRLAGHSAHPVLCGVWVGRGYKDAFQARRAISQAGHEANPGNRKQWLGKVDRNERIASPLHATVRRMGEMYHPVISEVIANQESQDKDSGYLEARNLFLRNLGVVLWGGRKAY